MSVESFAIATDIAARRRLGVTLAMSALVVLLALLSLGIGAVRLSPSAVAEALFGGGHPVTAVGEIGRASCRERVSSPV